MAPSAAWSISNPSSTDGAPDRRAAPGRMIHLRVEGSLLDLGTHIADQALTLFGKPEAVSADVRRERNGDGANDAFTIRLRYPGHTVVLGANCLSSLPRPRYHLRGTEGNYWKHGVDPQEAALNQVIRIEDSAWARNRPPTGAPCAWQRTAPRSPAPSSPFQATTASTTPRSATRSSARHLPR